MKKYIIIIILVVGAITGFAQSSNSNSILVRHDTTLLMAGDCEWIIKSLVKNDPALTSEIGKSVPLIIMEAIEKGRLKAIDPETNKPIPAKEIFTWKMGTDTLPMYDESGNISGYAAHQRRINEESITRVRIFQDWYFNIATGKFNSEIKWIELLSEISTSSGIFLGYAPLCRIYY